MTASPSSRTGVLVVRVWIEDEVGLRARLVGTLDVESPEETVRVVDSPEYVIAAVREWLDSFLSN